MADEDDARVAHSDARGRAGSGWWWWYIGEKEPGRAGGGGRRVGAAVTVVGEWSGRRWQRR